MPRSGGKFNGMRRRTRPWGQTVEAGRGRMALTWPLPLAAHPAAIIRQTGADNP